VVAILDSRLARRGYGKQFVDSLPPCSQAQTIAEVETFLSNGFQKVVEK